MVGCTQGNTREQLALLGRMMSDVKPILKGKWGEDLARPSHCPSWGMNQQICLACTPVLLSHPWRSQHLADGGPFDSRTGHESHYDCKHAEKADSSGLQEKINKSIGTIWNIDPWIQICQNSNVSNFCSVDLGCGSHETNQRAVQKTKVFKEDIMGKEVQ